MNTYEYVVARFTPNPVKDEPRNIGIIVVDSNSMKSFGKFVGDDYLTKLKKENPDTNVNALKKILEGYRGEQEIRSENYLDRLANQCVHSLHFKNVCVKAAVTPEKAVEGLFKEYISFQPQQVTA